MNGAPGVGVALIGDGLEFYVSPFAKGCEGWGDGRFWVVEGIEFVLIWV
jgi:hypothetical protein